LNKIAARELVNYIKSLPNCTDNGLLRKMRSLNIEEEMIVRVFADLIIAAGDTVR
jgi:hypothetical protein